MRLASSVSSSMESRGILPISFRYMRTGSSTVVPSVSTSFESVSAISSLAMLSRSLPSTVSITSIFASSILSYASSICSGEISSSSNASSNSS